jgi:acyl transferase domain-containing protein
MMSEDHEDIGQSVALVAWAGRVPGVNTLEEFWHTVADGQSPPHSFPATPQKDS